MGSHLGTQESSMPIRLHRRCSGKEKSREGMITEDRSVCFGNCPLEVLKLRSIGCTSLQVKENLTMVVYKSLSSVTRNPEAASPGLALSGVSGAQVCSTFLLIHSERVAKQPPPLLVSPLHSGRRQEGKREELSWLHPSPLVRKVEVPPGGPEAASGSLGSRGAGLSEINAGLLPEGAYTDKRSKPGFS